MIGSCRKEIQRGVKYILIGDKSKISQTRKQIVDTKDAKRVNLIFFRSRVTNNNFEFLSLHKNVKEWNFLNYY
jgi:hypothetical protein